LNVEKDYGAAGIMVAGYPNDATAHIPWARVLNERGHEARES
jgi:hypothetical protein